MEDYKSLLVQVLSKTKVLISRVAYLLISENIRPDNMIVTTFTKRAANEMMKD